MRKLNYMLFVLTLPLFMTCCTPKQEHDYTDYYDLSSVEVYCWKENDIWYSGALEMTDRTKTPDEVKWLQDNLPCPLDTMKSILHTYSSQSREYAFVCIVSVPPNEEELTHDVQLIYNQINTYRWVYNQLGLTFTFA